jgi:hypothetical protein
MRGASEPAPATHPPLTRAWWAACGWPAEVAEDVILARLLALNGERAALP